jgi:hypothetical protein
MDKLFWRASLETSRAVELVTGLKALQLTLSARAKRDAGKRDALSDLIGSLDKRLSMMASKDLIAGERVIASGIVEGAARYVVGERLDCRGMRWIPERAEATKWSPYRQGRRLRQQIARVLNRVNVRKLLNLQVLL